MRGFEYVDEYPKSVGKSRKSILRKEVMLLRGKGMLETRVN